MGFGTMLHEAHEQWLLHPDKDPVGEIMMDIAAATLAKVKASYTAVVGAPPDDEELAGVYENIETALHVIGNYKEHWGSSLPEGYTLVAPEQTILTPIPGTLHECEKCVGVGDVLLPGGGSLTCSECEGVGTAYHYLEATLDALLRNDAGLLFVLERKTYGQRPQLENLETNDQFLAYSWVVSKLNLGPVGGVVYDGMWRRRKEGKRTLDDLFIRHVLTRAPQEFLNFERELAIEANMMAAAQADPDKYVYRNFQWQGCWDCGSKPICLAEYRGEDSDWIRAKKYTHREGAEWLTVEED